MTYRLLTTAPREKKNSCFKFTFEYEPPHPLPPPQNSNHPLAPLPSFRRREGSRGGGDICDTLRGGQFLLPLEQLFSVQKCRGEGVTKPPVRRGQITGKGAVPRLHSMQANHGSKYKFCHLGDCAECRSTSKDCEKFVGQGRPECLISLTCGCRRDSRECGYEYVSCTPCFINENRLCSRTCGTDKITKLKKIETKYC